MAKANADPTTVDSGEIERHSNLSDIWWDSSGRIEVLHNLNGVRIPFILENLVTKQGKDRENSFDKTKPLAKIKILDIGCGGGIVSEPLARLGAKVTGVDASSDLIRLAKEHSNVDPQVARNKPTYICGTIEEHAQEFPCYYDAVVASEVLDHVANVEIFLKHCTEVLKPGGKMFITAPNQTRMAQFFGIFMAENVLNIIPKGIHHYENFITPKRVTELLAKGNCEVNEVHGIFYNPFTANWFWSYFQSVWYALVATKLCY